MTMLSFRENLDQTTVTVPELSAEKKQRRWGRRALATAVMTYGLGSVVTGVYNDRHFDDRSLEIVSLDQKPGYDGEQDIIIYERGFSEQETSVRRAGQAVLDHFADDDTIVLEIVPPARELSVIEIGEEIKNYLGEEGLQKIALRQAFVHVVGGSMGGPLLTNALATADIPIKTAVLVSSPSSPDTTRLSDALYGYTELTNRLTPPHAGRLFVFPDTVLTGLGQFQLARGREETLTAAAGRGIEKTKHGDDPTGLRETLGEFAIYQVPNDELCASLLPNYSQVLYVRSDEPASDSVVDVVAASNDWQVQVEEQCGLGETAFDLIEADYSGHNNMGRSLEAATDVIQQSIDDANSIKERYLANEERRLQVISSMLQADQTDQ